MKAFIRLHKWLSDPQRDFRDKLFALLVIIGEIAVALVFIADIILGENIVEIAVLGCVLAVSPVVMYFSIHRHRISLGSKMFAIAVAFVILPVTFFFGGGIYGGSVIWFSFAYLFIGLLLSGKWRIVMIVLMSVMAVCEYIIGFYRPDLIAGHTERMFYSDSAVSVVIVGIIILVMVIFQNRLFIMENKRAKEEAEKVEEMNLAQNRFFSNMSHEIRTPINTIIGLNEMILRENISEEVAEDAANISSASKMLLHLINDILDMSKLESGEMQISESPYRPGDMLSELVGMLWLRSKQKGLEFSVNVSPELPSELSGDEMRIKQILINLLNNAIKYTKEGSVSLSVQCGERSGNAVDVIYTVADTGMGIKKEDIPYLFTAFRRVDEKKNSHIEGTGLGLSIVKQLVDLMQGEVTVNSVYTKGSTFIIRIPQKVIGDQFIGEFDPEKNHGTGKLMNYDRRFEAPDARVLVVDDNSSNLLVVKKLLRDTKVNVDTASGGAEALKKTLNNEYHVIFMDHLMPEMDGIECMKKIRAQVGGRCRDSKIMALTANAGGDSKALYEREGFDGYLSKPISGDALERELCRLLPKDIVYLSGSDEEMLEDTISWMRSDDRKRNIIVTTESVADLPQDIIEKYGIVVLPHMVRTYRGVFRDGEEIETNGLLKYMRDGSRRVYTMSPDVKMHEEFFAEQLQRAYNVIHISISGKVAESGCPAAKEAAEAFENVFVVDTGHLSSGQGLMVIEACRLADSGKTPAEIIEALEAVKKTISTSFIVDNLDFLARSEQVSPGIAALTKAVMARPVLKMKKGELGIGRVFFGARDRAWKKYIDSVLRNKGSIDRELLFVTYVGLTKGELDEIREYIESKAQFGKICFHKASPAIAVNCGPGTFGLLLRRK